VKSVWINGKTYPIDPIVSGPELIKTGKAFDDRVLQIIRDWIQGKMVFVFNTSGSTGEPHSIQIARAKMLHSARTTLKFLNLESGTCLLCLDPEFIAGTMMIIRALVGNMDLFVVTPSSNPLKEFPGDISVDLCAFVPLQVRKILNDRYSSRIFQNISNILIGGADLPDSLISKIGKFSNSVYHTFGMTETATHIALQRLNGPSPDEYFQVVPGVGIQTDDRGCLVIKGEITGNNPLVTNDMVEIVDRSQFRWLGRIDHIINSGGIKVIVESLEKNIGEIFFDEGIILPFFISGIPDKKFGQRIAIIFESDPDQVDIKKIKAILKNKLKYYEIPKEWKALPAFLRTSTNKVNREKSLKKSKKIR